VLEAAKWDDIGRMDAAAGERKAMDWSVSGAIATKVGAR